MIRLSQILWLLVLVSVTGCNRGPEAIKMPKFRPDAMASEAIALYDKDSNGKLDGDELDACPGIKDGIRRVDQDGDGGASEEEISQRIASWVDTDTGGLPAAVQVTYQGQRLDGATVLFEPEPFLKDVVAPAQGVTGPTGRCDLSSEALPYGAQPGFYRVVITTQDGKIPAKYNTETTLGVEVSQQSPGYTQGRYVFDLK